MCSLGVGPASERVLAARRVGHAEQAKFIWLMRSSLSRGPGCVGSATGRRETIGGEPDEGYLERRDAPLCEASVTGSAGSNSNCL